MPDPARTPDPRELERAIGAYISSMPLSERHANGRLYIKVDVGEEQFGPKARVYIGVLFLSVPHASAEKEWLRTVMAHVREGFARGAISISSFRVTLGPDQPFESFHDEEAGLVLLNLPASLTLEASE
jgi:hypothetical protein